MRRSALEMISLTAIIFCSSCLKDSDSSAKQCKDSKSSNLNDASSDNPKVGEDFRLIEIDMSDGPKSHSGYVAKISESKLYIWGGCEGSNVSACEFLSKKGFVFDPKTSKWDRIDSKNSLSPRRDSFAYATDSELLVWGGCDTSSGSPWVKPTIDPTIINSKVGVEGKAVEDHRYSAQCSKNQDKAASLDLKTNKWRSVDISDEIKDSERTLIEAEKSGTLPPEYLEVKAFSKSAAAEKGLDRDALRKAGYNVGSISKVELMPKNRFALDGVRVFQVADIDITEKSALPDPDLKPINPFSPKKVRAQVLIKHKKLSDEAEEIHVLHHDCSLSISSSSKLLILDRYALFVDSSHISKISLDDFSCELRGNPLSSRNLQALAYVPNGDSFYLSAFGTGATTKSANQSSSCSDEPVPKEREEVVGDDWEDNGAGSSSTQASGAPDEDLEKTDGSNSLSLLDSKSLEEKPNSEYRLRIYRLEP